MNQVAPFSFSVPEHFYSRFIDGLRKLSKRMFSWDRLLILRDPAVETATGRLPDSLPWDAAKPVLFLSTRLMMRSLGIGRQTGFSCRLLVQFLYLRMHVVVCSLHHLDSSGPLFSESEIRDVRTHKVYQQGSLNQTHSPKHYWCTRDTHRGFKDKSFSEAQTITDTQASWVAPISQVD